MVDFHDQPDSDDSSSDDSSSDDSGSDDSGSDDELIHNFLQQNPHLAQALLKHHNGSIRLLLRKFIRSIDIKAIIRYLSSPEFRSALLKGVWNHKGKILFGIFLMCNPLAMTGFGVLGPTAGAFVCTFYAFGLIKWSYRVYCGGGAIVHRQCREWQRICYSTEYWNDVGAYRFRGGWWYRDRLRWGQGSVERCGRPTKTMVERVVGYR